MKVVDDADNDLATVRSVKSSSRVITS